MKISIQYEASGIYKEEHFYKNEITIGYDQNGSIECDVVPHSIRIQRYAQLRYYLGTWWIENLSRADDIILNGSLVHEKAQLSPRDHLQLGVASIWVMFYLKDKAMLPGKIENEQNIDEDNYVLPGSEDRRLLIYSHIAQITSRLQGQPLLEAFLDEIVLSFPQADQWTIALIEDDELVHRVFKPKPYSRMSNYLARRAIVLQQAFQWVREIHLMPDETSISSLNDINAALYAPITVNQRVIGVVYIGSTVFQTLFSENELRFLRDIANIIGPSIQASLDKSFDQLPHVFVSYAKSDRKWVERLAGNLRRRTVKVFFDERAQVGMERNLVIKKAIRSVDGFLFVIPTDQDQTALIKKEYEQAELYHKPIIPITIGTASYPDFLKNVQPFDLSEEGYDKNIQSLSDIIRRLPKQEAPQVETITKVLFLAANPIDTQLLQLDEEVRAIDICLRTTKLRDRFQLIQHWAVRFSDLEDLLLHHQPHIVHFSGHGSQKGDIILKDKKQKAELISPERMAALFRLLKGNIQCVFLNACWSQKVADAISKEVDCVIGISRSIEDEAAIEFSGGFYQAIGYGRSIQDAFQLGCLQISSSERKKPRLVTKPGVNPADLVFE